MSEDSKIVLEVKNLQTTFKTDEGTVHANNGISYTIREGEIVGMVGESGSGKSVSCLSIMGLIPIPPGRVVADKLEFCGESLLNKNGELDQGKLNKLRGHDITMIFQDPMTSLNPFLTIKTQMIEAVMLHKGLSKKDAVNLAIEKLDLVGIADAKNRLNSYPHEFSGGMRQRVMIAMALMCDPKLLVADEPTTALDVTIQAQILELLKELNEKLKMSIIFITHDLGVIAGVSHKVFVMYGGTIVESGPTDLLFAKTGHPYTQGLLSSIPKLHEKQERLTTIKGSPPYLLQKPDFCPFHTRCPKKKDECLQGLPEYVVLDEERQHKAACILYKS
ncbi:ABC transporter ATP-binding protein [Candidatus Uabimicrobium amorphum]|uniref:ABC transporter ATP-binding protein n=1 Tax=Uabimicrobium amorphum TaxID=2596890 RepID=A0A5S9F4N4_UABAM|nr:ABC transporter ATP-binding protein [Candidatus Uabimicrobium amorphum]BBM85293.1 ABC transporter ATP-binding protein [Candidatus Uabimicrobium amorphum]